VTPVLAVRAASLGPLLERRVLAEAYGWPSRPRGPYGADPLAGSSRAAYRRQNACLGLLRPMAGPAAAFACSRDEAMPAPEPSPTPDVTFERELARIRTAADPPSMRCRASASPAATVLDALRAAGDWREAGQLAAVLPRLDIRQVVGGLGTLVASGRVERRGGDGRRRATFRARHP
jgi:hypothetical protein